MKNAFILASLLLFSLTACKKNNNPPEPDLTEDLLTECPPGAYCGFYFADYAGMDGYHLSLSTGQYRVFWTHATVGYSSFSLYVMAPMIGDRFTMTKEDFIAGRVKFQDNCANCLSSGILPVDGQIKGQRMPGIKGQPDRWLVESDLTFPAEKQASTRPAIHLKQYYIPALK